MRIPLIGGSYVARSPIAMNNISINLYPEANPKGALAPQTLYQRPGFRRVAIASPGPIRGIWARTDGDGAYVVSRQNVYFMDNQYNLTLLGALTTSTSGPVSMTDNGVVCFLVDGQPGGGYLIALATNIITPIVDPAFYAGGGQSVDYLDTFLLYSYSQSLGATNLYASTLPGSATFNSLFTAAKAGYPDPLVKLLVNKRALYLFGTLRSEIWYNAGGQQFPFTILPGVYIQHGTNAPYSVCAQDIEVYWLSNDAQGNGMVLKQRGYETKRISNHALEWAMIQMKQQSLGTLAGAIGYIHQTVGHVFYVLTFPSANQTWVYDAAIADPNEAWHQRSWVDNNGTYNRDRSSCGAFLTNGWSAPSGNPNSGQFIVGDWQEPGNLYILDPNYFFDDTDNVAQPQGGNPGRAPINCVRTFAHIGVGKMQGSDQLVESDGRRMRFNRLYADIQGGTAAQSVDSLPPQITLRWSYDRGVTYGNGILQSVGSPGQFQTWPEWRTQGIARDRVFELYWNATGPMALQGAWVDVEVLDS